MTELGSLSSEGRSHREEAMLEKRLASVFRALSGDPGVDLWAHRPVDSRGTLPMNAPHLYPNPRTSGLDSLRGATDAMAMRRRFSDLEVHRALLPDAREERLLVEILEQCRCESLVVQSGSGPICRGAMPTGAASTCAADSMRPIWACCCSPSSSSLGPP